MNRPGNQVEQRQGNSWYPKVKAEEVQGMNAPRGYPGAPSIHPPTIHPPTPRSQWPRAHRVPTARVALGSLKRRKAEFRSLQSPRSPTFLLLGREATQDTVTTDGKRERDKTLPAAGWTRPTFWPQTVGRSFSPIPLF